MFNAAEQQKWAYKLQGYEFDVCYKPGRSNIVADALSRKFQQEDTPPNANNDLMLAISSPVPVLVSQIQQHLKAV